MPLYPYGKYTSVLLYTIHFTVCFTLRLSCFVGCKFVLNNFLLKKHMSIMMIWQICSKFFQFCWLVSDDAQGPAAAGCRPAAASAVFSTNTL